MISGESEEKYEVYQKLSKRYTKHSNYFRENLNVGVICRNFLVKCRNPYL